MQTRTCDSIHIPNLHKELQKAYDQAATTMTKASLLWNENKLSQRIEAIRIVLFTRVALLKTSLLTIPRSFRLIQEYILSSLAHSTNKTVTFYLSIIKTSALFIGKVIIKQLLTITSGLFPEVLLNKVQAHNLLFTMQVEEFLLTLPPLHILNTRQHVFDPLPMEEFLLAVAEHASIAKKYLRIELLKKEHDSERSTLFDTSSKVFQESLRTAIEQILQDPQIYLIHQELDTHTFFDKFVTPILQLFQMCDSFLLKFLSKIQEEVLFIQNTPQTPKALALLTTIYEQSCNILPERKEDDLFFFSLEQDRAEHILKATHELSLSMQQYLHHARASEIGYEDFQSSSTQIALLKTQMQQSLKNLVSAPQILLHLYGLDPNTRAIKIEQITLAIALIIEANIQSLYAHEEPVTALEERPMYDFRREKTKAMCDIFLQSMIRAKDTLLNEGLIEEKNIEAVEAKTYQAILHTALHYLIKDAIVTHTNLAFQGNTTKIVVLTNDDEFFGALPYFQKLKNLHTSLFTKEDEQEILHVLSGKAPSSDRFFQYEQAISNQESKELLNRITSIDNVAPQDKTDWSLAFSV